MSDPAAIAADDAYNGTQQGRADERRQVLIELERAFADYEYLNPTHTDILSGMRRAIRVVKTGGPQA